jgi:sortase A
MKRDSKVCQAKPSKLLEFIATNALLCKSLMEIILYRAGEPAKKILPALRRSISFWSKRARLISKRAINLVGISLMLLSLLILLASLGPVAVQEINYRFNQKPFASSKGSSLNPTKDQRQEVAEEALTYGVSTDFSIVIPKISAKAKIIPNVNPADEKEYKSALKQGVAHALGTKFPGNKGVIYLFAHSTNSPVNISRYNAVFYLLKELRENDEIIIFFAGQKYVYRVAERLVTAADDTKWLTGEEKEEQLILQTCWPPGTSQKRLLVIAKPV